MNISRLLVLVVVIQVSAQLIISLRLLPQLETLNAHPPSLSLVNSPLIEILTLDAEGLREERPDCHDTDLSKLEYDANRIWQIAVPNCGTSTLEQILRSATQQSFDDRFGESRMCSLCDENELQQLLEVNFTRKSGSHSDWTQSNQLFQSTEEVMEQRKYHRN